MSLVSALLNDGASEASAVARAATSTSPRRSAQPAHLRIRGKLTTAPRRAGVEGSPCPCRYVRFWRNSSVAVWTAIWLTPTFCVGRFLRSCTVARRWSSLAYWRPGSRAGRADFLRSARLGRNDRRLDRAVQGRLFRPSGRLGGLRASRLSGDWARPSGVAYCVVFALLCQVN